MCTYISPPIPTIDSPQKLPWFSFVPRFSWA